MERSTHLGRNVGVNDLLHQRVCEAVSMLSCQDEPVSAREPLQAAEYVEGGEFQHSGKRLSVEL